MDMKKKILCSLFSSCTQQEQKCIHTYIHNIWMQGSKQRHLLTTSLLILAALLYRYFKGFSYATNPVTNCSTNTFQTSMLTYWDFKEYCQVNNSVRIHNVTLQVRLCYNALILHVECQNTIFFSSVLRVAIKNKIQILPIKIHQQSRQEWLLNSGGIISMGNANQFHF